MNMGVNGCRWCGVGEREHMSRFALVIGQHTYIAPSDEQRIARMQQEPECADHNPRQHRDGKPPWCRNCGLTKDFKKPTSIFDRRKD